MIQRYLRPILLESLSHFPVVALLGARQVGKSTLVQDVAAQEWPAPYYSLDEFSLFSAASTDPDGFVDGLPLPVVLDEVQRVPDLLRSIKRRVDKHRKPGMFLVTGSANPLTMMEVSESLAGRVALLELHTFSFSELNGKKDPPVSLEILFSARTAEQFLDLIQRPGRNASRDQLATRILSGGYPVPALMKPGRMRLQWFDSYRQTYLERDVRQITNISNLPDFGRLLWASAARTAQLLNMAEISRELGIPLNTVKRHLAILESTYQIHLVRPYFANIQKRLVKTPKIYFTDTGLAAYLMNTEEWETVRKQGREGAFVETWAANELRKLISLSAKKTNLFFYRTHAGYEVDFLISRGESLVALEVKWTQSLKAQHLSRLEQCHHDLGKHLGLSVVLYPGSVTFAINQRTAVVPFSLFF